MKRHEEAAFEAAIEDDLVARRVIANVYHRVLMNLYVFFLKT